MSSFSDFTVVVFAWRRPYYLREVLSSWKHVPEVRELGRFIVALGESDRRDEQMATIAEAAAGMNRPIEVLPDSPAAAAAPGMHRAMGEAAHYAWTDPETGFVALFEEDTFVSDDVLAYMQWARRFESDPRVLAVCAHNQSGTAWDIPSPDEAEADQETVRLKQYFCSWGWGTWRDRWAGVLEPSWDWDCTSGDGTGMPSGCDWNIYSRVMPGRFVSAVPDASRTQNIGRDEGVYAVPDMFYLTQAQSFRERRGRVIYKMSQPVRPSVVDPPEVSEWLWDGFSGEYGWDVGANCGQSLPVMCQLFGRFTAFEPCPGSFGFYQEHFSFADVRQLALSDHDGELELAFPAKEQKETGQLVTVGLRGMEWEPEDWDAVEKVTVPCRTADSLAAELGAPDFMKIDTEGHEDKVLAGAAGLLAAGKTNFLIEFHSPENRMRCVAALKDAGYRGQTIRHPHYKIGSQMWYQHGWLRAFAPSRERAD